MLVGSYGRGNVGDDVFLLSALKLFSGYTIYINAADPDLLPKKVRSKVRVVSTQAGRDVAAKLRMWRHIQHIVYCGGDLWVELYGDRFPRQSLYKMLGLNIIARLCGKRVHYLGCGIGKLRGYSLWLARMSARLAGDIAVREQRSADVLALPNVQVLPDLATVLDYPLQSQRSKRRFTIGVSVLYHLPDPATNFPRLTHALAKLLEPLDPAEYEIVLFPMLVAPGENRDDAWASEQLQKQLPSHNPRIVAAREFDEYVQELAGLDVLIGARLHANILASLCGVPCLGIAYRPKVAQFFRSQNIADYCLELNQLGQLPKRLANLIQHHPQARQTFATIRQNSLQQGANYHSYVKTHF
jgi:polysaccharide pyruvyl transferase WcaK-like protein